MSDVKRVSPKEAQALLENGYVYLDVRTEEEFREGHVPGALNVPFMLRGPGGMTPNPDFMSVMESAFDRGERIVVGCRSGGRSLRAATLLIGGGFSNIVDMRTGWDAGRDAFGRVEPGWSREGLPVETDVSEAQSYEGVKKRKPG